MPIGPARMPILDHLGELRRRLLIIVVALAVGAGVSYIFSLDIIRFLVAPIEPLMGGAKLNYFNALGAFSLRFKVSLYSAVVFMSPVILWQIFGFFLPALKPKERKWIVPTVLTAVVLFLIGNVFCYLVIIPTAYEWMFSQAGDLLTFMPNAEVLVNSLVLFLLGFGVAFEVPLVIFYLVVFDIVKYSVMRKNWRIIYLVLLIISAVATPDASPVTMFLMFIALDILYEISLLMAYIVSGQRHKAKKKEGLIEEDEDEAAWDI